MPTIVRISVTLNILTLCNCFISNDQDLVTAKDAEIRCENKGGLVKHNELLYNGVVNLNPEKLDSIGLSNGETAWIHGVVRYSEYLLAWYGCADLKTSIGIPTIHVHDDYNSIYECMEVCANYGSFKVVLIGVEGHMCYCFNESNYFSHNSKCFGNAQRVQYPWEYNEIDSKLLNVYKVFSDSSMGLTSTDLFQCIIAKVNTEKQVLHETRPCLPRRYNVEFGTTDGFVCTYDAKTDSTKQTCNGRYTDGSTNVYYCDIRKNLSLSSARSYCRNIPGMLVPFYNPSKFNNLPLNKTYWAGMFRVFEVSSPSGTLLDDQYPDISLKTCLGITRIDTRIHLDPDTCSTPKRYICADMYLPPSSNKSDLIVYICVALAGIAFVIAAGLFIISRRRHNVCKQALVPGRQECRGTDPNSHAFPSGNCDIMDANYTEVNADFYTERVFTSAVMLSSDDYDHITHHKSAPSQNSEQVNVYGCTQQISNNEEYDVINTRGIATQKNQSFSHVYDSTSCFENEKKHSKVDVTH